MSDFLQGEKGKSDLLRTLVAGRETIIAPGAYDALTARIIEQASFPAVYMTGFGATASLLGRPDVGLLAMSEMVENARRMAQALHVPLIADADTGYGNPLNVIRTVQEYERAGVSAIHIEDQITPKKCGHMENMVVVSALEMMEKIHAAIEARTSPDFLIIARTDARAVEGGKTPPVSLDRLRELGYRIVIFPIGALLAATAAVRKLGSGNSGSRDADRSALRDDLFHGVQPDDRAFGDSATGTSILFRDELKSRADCSNINHARRFAFPWF